MFGNVAGMSGNCGWQGHQSNNNINPEALAQTLVSVAQNILTSQKPQVMKKIINCMPQMIRLKIGIYVE